MKFKDPDELKEWLIAKHVDLEDAKAAAGSLFDANFTSSDSLEDAPATDLRPALSVPLSNIVSKKLKTTGGEGWVTKDTVKDIVKETVKETLASVSSATSESDSKSTGSKRSHGSDAGHYSGKRRDTKRQAEMSAAVMKRDGKCLLTGSGLEHALDCAHIVGLENIESFPRDMHYAPSMGFALRKDLHPSYDRHEWYFKPDGSVVKLRPNTVELPKNIAVPAELDKTAMGVKETLALASADGRCSYCWKKVGMVNMTEHRKRSCSDPTLAKGTKPTDWSSAGSVMSR